MRVRFLQNLSFIKITLYNDETREGGVGKFTKMNGPSSVLPITYDLILMRQCCRTDSTIGVDHSVPVPMRFL